MNGVGVRGGEGRTDLNPLETIDEKQHELYIPLIKRLIKMIMIDDDFDAMMVHQTSFISGWVGLL